MGEKCLYLNSWGSKVSQSACRVQSKWKTSSFLYVVLGMVLPKMPKSNMFGKTPPCLSLVCDMRIPAATSKRSLDCSPLLQHNLLLLQLLSRVNPPSGVCQYVWVMQVAAKPLDWNRASRCRGEIVSINSSKTTAGVRSLPTGLHSDFPAGIMDIGYITLYLILKIWGKY